MKFLLLSVLLFSACSSFAQRTTRNDSLDIAYKYFYMLSHDVATVKKRVEDAHESLVKVREFKILRTADEKEKEIAKAEMDLKLAWDGVSSWYSSMDSISHVLQVLHR